MKPLHWDPDAPVDVSITTIATEETDAIGKTGFWIQLHHGQPVASSSEAVLTTARRAWLVEQEQMRRRRGGRR